MPVLAGDAFATSARVPNAIRLALANPRRDELPELLNRCMRIIDGI